MAKIRQISDKIWHRFEAERKIAQMQEEEYLLLLLNGIDIDEVQEDYKQQAHDAINAMGKAKTELEKHKANAAEFAETIARLTAERVNYEERIKLLDTENNEYSDRIEEQKKHIEAISAKELSLNDTIKELGDKLKSIQLDREEQEKKIKDLEKQIKDQVDIQYYTTPVVNTTDTPIPTDTDTRTIKIETLEDAEKALEDGDETSDPTQE